MKYRLICNIEHIGEPEELKDLAWTLTKVYLSKTGDIVTFDVEIEEE